MLCFLFLSLFALADVGIRPGPWPPRGYVCQYAQMPLQIDGDLEEPGWSQAAWSEDFIDIEGELRPPPRYHTRVKMAWDQDYFYVAAQMEEPDLWATLRQRDSVIYHDNDFEVFLDPDGDSHLYTEIEINAFNTVWDLLLVRPYRDGGPALHAWDIPGLKTAVQLQGTINDPSDQDTGWTVEIAIPFAVLQETTRASCPPQSGDRWRVNFSRVQWRLESTPIGYHKSTHPNSGKPYPEDNWVWSPQREIAMHEPEHWGIVEFRERAGGDSVVPLAKDAAAWHLRFASYHLRVQFDAEGHYPERFVVPELPDQAPALPDSWVGLPSYWSDGRRYTLSLRAENGLLQLDETGRLSVIERK